MQSTALEILGFCLAQNSSSQCCEYSKAIDVFWPLFFIETVQGSLYAIALFHRAAKHATNSTSSHENSDVPGLTSPRPSRYLQVKLT